jgi:hypothetical protein
MVSEIVKDPLHLAEQQCDLLTTGEGWAHGSVVGMSGGSDSAPPSVSHSLTGRPST